MPMLHATLNQCVQGTMVEHLCLVRQANNIKTLHISWMICRIFVLFWCDERTGKELINLLFE